MKKNYNYNYVNRTTTKSLVNFTNLELASCTSADLKKCEIINGRLWHTTDTNEFYYDWNNKRNKLDVTCGSASVSEEIDKIKSEIKKLNPDKVNQLETKVNNAVSKVNNIKSDVDSAIADAEAATNAAQDAATLAQDAASQVSDKASTSYVDDAVAHAFDNLTAAQKAELKGDKGDAGEKGEKGDAGAKGDQGEKGDPFTYEDFTPEQLEALKGEKGDKGDKGDAGEKGEKGDPGVTGEKGDKGDPFTYEDFTPEQLEALKGEKGDKGDKGDAGEKGDKGDAGEKGEKGDPGVAGEKGDKGDKGDPFTYEDFTPEQLEALKGEKGDQGEKGEKGDKGDTGTFDASELENYPTRDELVERLGIIGQDSESNAYEYIYDKNSWEASYNDGVLKEYYIQYPNEDLWNFDTNSAPGFNDKIYTVKEYTDAACEGEYVVKQYKAQWYSDNGVQKIIDVNDNTVEYYIPTFFDVPTQIFELFAGAEGGYVATPDDLVYPCDKWIKIDSVTFGGPNVRPAWEAAVSAPGAQFPWIAVKIENVSNKIVKFDYEGKDSVYPWGEKKFGLGGKAWGIASVAKEWEENGFLIPANASNGDASWSSDEDGFDISKFKMSLVTPSSVKDYVDAAVAGVPAGEKGDKGDKGDPFTYEDFTPEQLEALKGEKGDTGTFDASELENYSTKDYVNTAIALIDVPTEGVFPDMSGSDSEDPTVAEVDGFAKVQDVMDYVNALFEKKKDELGDSGNYFYVNGVLYENGNETQTPIYQMNCYEIGEEVNTPSGFIAEVVISPEIMGFLDDTPNSNATIYSELFTVDVPVGYSIEVHNWDDLTNQYSVAEERMMANPKGATKQYGSKTYNSYEREVNDPYGEALNGSARYKIIITKD